MIMWKNVQRQCEKLQGMRISIQLCRKVLPVTLQCLEAHKSKVGVVDANMGKGNLVLCMGTKVIQPSCHHVVVEEVSSECVVCSSWLTTHVIWSYSNIS